MEALIYCFDRLGRWVIFGSLSSHRRALIDVEVTLPDLNAMQVHRRVGHGE